MGWNRKVNVVLHLSLVFFMTAIVLFILGGLFYRHQHPKEANYKEDMCLVLTLGYQNYTCRTRYSKYSCYGPVWNAQREREPFINATVETGKKYRSIAEAQGKTTEHEINTRASCWYDQRQPSIAQWNKPSARTGRILLICGGLSTLFMILFLFLSCYCYQQDERGEYASP